MTSKAFKFHASSPSTPFTNSCSFLALPCSRQLSYSKSGLLRLPYKQNCHTRPSHLSFTQSIPVLEAFLFATVLCGFFGIIFKKNLMMKIIAMDVMSTGVIAYYVLIASRDGFLTPIVSNAENAAYADPVPQAVILTAIVIGFSIQALMLVSVMKLARDNPTLESSEIEKNNTP